MRGLASFMRNVIANPYLRNDHTLKVFLTLVDSGAGEWEQAKKVLRYVTLLSVLCSQAVCVLHHPAGCVCW